MSTMNGEFGFPQIILSERKLIPSDIQEIIDKAKIKSERNRAKNFEKVVGRPRSRSFNVNVRPVVSKKSSTVKKTSRRVKRKKTSEVFIAPPTNSGKMARIKSFIDVSEHKNKIKKKSSKRTSDTTTGEKKGLKRTATIITREKSTNPAREKLKRSQSTIEITPDLKNDKFRYKSLDFAKSVETDDEDSDSLPTIKIDDFESPKLSPSRHFALSVLEERDIIYNLGRLNEDSENEDDLRTGSTLEDLISSFSDSNENQMLVNYTFLSHSTFISNIDLLQTLIKIYDDAKKIGRYQALYSVYDVFSCWFHFNHYDFENPTLLPILGNFMIQLAKSDETDMEILDMIIADIEKSYTITEKGAAPPPLLSKKKLNDDNLKITDFKSLEIARQITLIDYRLMSNITPNEILTQDASSRNYRGLIDWHNKIETLVIHQILSHRTPKKRAKIIDKFLSIADNLLMLQNYSSYLAMCSGILHFTIQRLSKTMKHIDESKIQKISDISSPLKNFHNLRALYESAEYPFIPPQEVVVKDLIFINEGNETYINEENDILNINKLILLGKILYRFHRIKQEPFNFQLVGVIQQYLKDYPHNEEQALEELSKSRE